jgi:integrase
MSVAKLRAHHIEDLYADLLASGQSGSSIRKVHWALRQSLAWAHKPGLTGIIATLGVELPPLRERKLSPPSSADVRKVVEHQLGKDPDWGTMFALIAWTGCRRGEACGLRWEDLDLPAVEASSFGELWSPSPVVRKESGPKPENFGASPSVHKPRSS